tara:strand:- start:108909 stop:110147 length:1239 start_codon:yes stop_codon:yes gene_type:complete
MFHWTEISSELSSTDADESAASDKRIALVGRFGAMNRREAAGVLRSYGATIVDASDQDIHWIVVGAEESPLAESELLSEAIHEAAATSSLEIIGESELWQRLGLVEAEQSIRRYHTPAMLAHLLGVDVSVIRRWHRRGLITPVRTMHKLPYFDFQEVATARRLAQWIASGASPKAIEHRLVELVEILPDIQRPIDQLSILIEGKQVLLRQGDGLIETGGQLRFDFDAMEKKDDNARDQISATLSVFPTDEDSSLTFPLRDSPAAAEDPLLASVFEAEDADLIETAIDGCHGILARDGPRADISFLLGELLYRSGEPIAARERYYTAIELEPEFVEARTSLGCVLAETGQRQLAIAAFRGALELHEEYPDAHYNLARALDDEGQDTQAKQHWQRFLELAPNSPWAAEAQARLD